MTWSVILNDFGIYYVKCLGAIPLSQYYRSGLSSLIDYGVVVNMFDFHRSDRGSNPARGGKRS